MDIFLKGQEGEQALNNWLKSNGLSYLYVDQSLETFATLFNGSLKRPDFLVLLESIGMIAVDSKNKQLWDEQYYSLGFENEFQKALTFERVFRIPLWYAYRCQKEDREVWYWISALKAMEVGKLKTNSQSGEQFLLLHLSYFEEISSAMDLGKLYTHRLQSLKAVMKVESFARATTPEGNGGDSPETAHKPAITFEEVYDLSNDYHQENINNILFWLEFDTEFPVFYRKSEGKQFSTMEDLCDGDVVAVIDALSKTIMMEAGAFNEAITFRGCRREDGGNLVLDHLIYAVSSVYFDDGGGGSYEVRIDDSKLTSIGQKIVKELRKAGKTIGIGRNGHYSLWVAIA